MNNTLKKAQVQDVIMEVGNAIIDSTGRNCDNYMDNTMMWAIESENEGASIVGYVRDRLSKRNLTWVQLPNQPFWKGAVPVDDGGWLAVSLMYRRTSDKKLTFFASVAVLSVP